MRCTEFDPDGCLARYASTYDGEWMFVYHDLDAHRECKQEQESCITPSQFKSMRSLETDGFPNVKAFSTECATWFANTERFGSTLEATAYEMLDILNPNRGVGHSYIDY